LGYLPPQRWTLSSSTACPSPSPRCCFHLCSPPPPRSPLSDL
jgi:hypothetical protein